MTRQSSAFIAINMIAFVFQALISIINFGEFNIAIIVGAYCGLLAFVVFFSCLISFISGAFKEGSFSDAFHLSYVLLLFFALFLESVNIYPKSPFPSYVICLAALFWIGLIASLRDKEESISGSSNSFIETKSVQDNDNKTYNSDNLELNLKSSINKDNVYASYNKSDKNSKIKDALGYLMLAILIIAPFLIVFRRP